MGLLVSLLILLSSSQPVEAYRIYTPEVYYTWNSELEGCTGYDVDIDDIDFYVVPVEAWYSPLNGHVNGEYLPATSDQRAIIYLAYPRMYEKMLVKHEITHHHLNVPGHPSPPFEDCEYR